MRVGTDRMLLVLATGDVRRVLEGSPSPFAADPEAKRKGMVHFQPDALTISRGAEWQSRRRFTEAVLGQVAADRVTEVVRDEVRDLIAGPVRAADGELRWDDGGDFDPAAVIVLPRRILPRETPGHSGPGRLYELLLDLLLEFVHAGLGQLALLQRGGFAGTAAG